MRTCPCGATIPDYEPAWKKICLECFKTKKRQQVDGLREMYIAAITELATLKRQLGSGSGLDQAMVTKLLLLCHPDHHDNSDLSNEVTRFLVALRQKMRQP